MIALDTSVFLYLVNPATHVPLDPGTGRPVTRCAERVAHLVAGLSKAGTKLALPTPVLTESLVSTGLPASAVLVQRLDRATLEWAAEGPSYAGRPTACQV